MTMTRQRDYQAALRALNAMQIRQPLQGRSRLNAREKMAAWMNALDLDTSTATGFVHVAGTKGKGTTCLYGEHVISTYFQNRSMPRKVGCYTKPHVMSVTERIRINSQAVDEAAFAAYFWELLEKMEARHLPDVSPPLYPGFMLLLALWIFKAEAVDVAIIEAGIGGETDSSNAIPRPSATGITRIGLDHLAVLAPDISSIAWHKAGIMKQGVPAFSVPQAELASVQLKGRAVEKATELSFVTDRILDELNITVTPNAAYQRHNAALATELIRSCVQFKGWPALGAQDLIGLKDTSLPAKFEIVHAGRVRYVLSIAHNEMSVQSACKEYFNLIGDNPHGRNILVLGTGAKRNSKALLDTIDQEMLLRGKFFDKAFFCPPPCDEGPADFVDVRWSLDEHFAEAKECEKHWNTLRLQIPSSAVRSATDVLVDITHENTDCTVFVVGLTGVTGFIRHLIKPKEGTMK